MFGLRFVKVLPTTYLMAYRAGRLVREGAGLAILAYAPSTSLVAVPIASRDAPFIFAQVTRDFQTVTVQGQVAYRVADPRKLAAMLNFALAASFLGYESDDPQKLPTSVSAGLASAPGEDSHDGVALAALAMLLVGGTALVAIRGLRA